ncbi:MAG: DUF2247 family protein [Chlamydiae bacterium]|nr:DUF2247 family protein [Chlamydiota bacterium]
MARLLVTQIKYLRKIENMTVFDVMKKFKLLDWHTLLVGLQQEWCKKQDLIKYGEKILEETESAFVDDNLAIIASGETLAKEHLLTVVLNFLAKHEDVHSENEKAKAVEKWRYAHLYWLLQSDKTEQKKIDLLQELYAQFGFPDDMAECSIYSRGEVDPLVATATVVEKLSQKLFIER